MLQLCILLGLFLELREKLLPGKLIQKIIPAGVPKHLLICRLGLVKSLRRGLGDCSGVKNTDCFFRGPRFSSSHMEAHDHP